MPTYVHDYTFVYVQFHLPCLGPIQKLIDVLLDILKTIFRVNGRKNLSVICEFQYPTYIASVALPMALYKYVYDYDYDGRLLCNFNVAIKGLKFSELVNLPPPAKRRFYAMTLFICRSVR